MNNEFESCQSNKLNYTDKQIHDGTKRMSIEKIKSYKGLENISDEEAEEISDSIYEMTVIAYKLYMLEMQKKNKRG